MIRLHRRQNPSRFWVYAAPVVALVLTLFSGLLLFAALGVPVGEASYAFFVEPLTTRYGLTELGVKAAPLIICLLYTSPSPRDATLSRMPSSA